MTFDKKLMSVFYHARMEKLLKKILHWLGDLLFPARNTEMIVRNTHMQELLRLYRPQRVDAASFTSEIIALLPYRLPLVQACCIEAKFHRNKKAHILLGKVLAQYLKSYAVYGPQSDFKCVLIPLPLGKKRLKERRYNQVEEIAKQALLALGCGVDCALGFPSYLLRLDVLLRVRDTLPQSTLGRAERLKNMEGAFLVPHPLDPKKLYVLLDDVVTTGATLRAAREALRNAGAQKVCIVAVAH
jgi:predicted amidophosphoribosyltransferase